jgi:hypothetical protein
VDKRSHVRVDGSERRHRALSWSTSLKIPESRRRRVPGAEKHTNGRAGATFANETGPNDYHWVLVPLAWFGCLKSIKPYVSTGLSGI